MQPVRSFLPLVHIFPWLAWCGYSFAAYRSPSLPSTACAVPEIPKLGDAERITVVGGKKERNDTKRRGNPKQGRYGSEVRL